MAEHRVHNLTLAARVGRHEVVATVATATLGAAANGAGTGGRDDPAQHRLGR